jgi:2-dehydro-3-deoxygluconokinase
LPQGVDLKNTGVIYDREYSSFSQLQPGQIKWHEILKDVSWFHFSAISPALNENVATVCLEALKVAAEKGITISVDLNYRSKLWQYGKESMEVMPQLVKYCDVVMGNIWAFEKMLGITIDADMPREKEGFLQQAKKSSADIIQQFSKCSQVASTFRIELENNLTYYTTLWTNSSLYVSNEYRTQEVVDKVGSGDAFMAGLIYGNLQRWLPNEKIDFAAAAAFDKLFIKGDATTSKVEEINKRLIRHE